MLATTSKTEKLNAVTHSKALAQPQAQGQSTGAVTSTGTTYWRRHKHGHKLLAQTQAKEQSTGAATRQGESNGAVTSKRARH